MKHAAFISTSVLVLFLLAVLWPPKRGEVGAYFPGVQTVNEAYMMAVASHATVVATTPYPAVMILNLSDEQERKALLEQGAILFNPLKLSGCYGARQTKEKLSDQRRFAT